MTNKNYAELGQLCQEFSADSSLEIVAFPCNQFGAQESGTEASIRTFVDGKLAPFGVEFTVCQKANVNGADAHPVYHFLKYNAPELNKSWLGGVLPIPWNFSKFLVDRQGRVYKFYGSATPPSAIKGDILGLMSGALEGSPSKRPNTSPDNAPPGFAPRSSAP